MTALYYVIPNRISPVVCIFGRWPSRANMQKQIDRHGVYLLSREITPAEAEWLGKQYRHMALAWPTLEDMIREESDYLGESFEKKLRDAVMKNKTAVVRALAEANKKRQAYEAEKLARKARAA